MTNRTENYAFAIGYLAGFDEGREANPYDNEEQAILYRAYREGYDCGIADYCAFAHPEEINT